MDHITDDTIKQARALRERGVMIKEIVHRTGMSYYNVCDYTYKVPSSNTKKSLRTTVILDRDMAQCIRSYAQKNGTTFTRVVCNALKLWMRLHNIT